MIAALFHGERFRRDAAGTYFSTALPYRRLARYLQHFDGLVVVGRLDNTEERARTVASGPGVTWACVEGASLPRWAARYTARAREVMARVDCAIIHLPGVLGPMACRAAAESGKPWMVEVVGDLFGSLWNHGSLRGKLAALPLHLLNRRAIAHAPFAIYVAEAMERSYPSTGTWVAASDVVLEPPRQEVLARRVARIEARAGRAAPVLGLVGSYDVEYKGHETALQALALLRRSGHPVTLRCIGVGDPSRWQARARKLGVEGAIQLGGALPHGARVLAWMDELDLCIAPSFTEGLPRALLEAMSRALPAVASRVGGVPELIEDRWLHRPRDHRALASLVAALLDAPGEMKAQARRNWRTAASYAPEVLEPRRDALLRQLKASALARVSERPWAAEAAPR